MRNLNKSLCCKEQKYALSDIGCTFSVAHVRMIVLNRRTSKPVVTRQHIANHTGPLPYTLDFSKKADLSWNQTQDSGFTRCISSNHSQQRTLVCSPRLSFFADKTRDLVFPNLSSYRRIFAHCIRIRVPNAAVFWQYLFPF